MSYEVTAHTFTAHAIQIGTKKAPVQFAAPRCGVMLAAGKVGTDARKAEKGDMVNQARNGFYFPLVGFLAATFPKAVAQYETRIASKLAMWEDLGDLSESAREEIEAKKAQLLKAKTPTNKEGVAVLVQCVLNWAADAKKVSKAQTEALAIVNAFVSGT